MAYTMTDEAREQRQEATREHGVYSVRDRGVDAMTLSQRSMYVELKEQLETPDGTLEAIRDLATNSLLLAKIAQSWCIEQHKEGVPLDKIPLLKALPAFLNSASRQLKAYFAMIPKDPLMGAYSAELKKIEQALRKDGKGDGHSSS